MTIPKFANKDHSCCKKHNSHSVSDASLIEVMNGMTTAAAQVTTRAARGDDPDAPTSNRYFTGAGIFSSPRIPCSRNIYIYRQTLINIKTISLSFLSLVVV